MPVLFATWAYQRGGAKLAAKGWAYDEMVRRLAEVYRKAALDSGVTVRDNLTGLSPSYPTDTGLILLRAYPAFRSLTYPTLIPSCAPACSTNWPA